MLVVPCSPEAPRRARPLPPALPRCDACAPVPRPPNASLVYRPRLSPGRRFLRRRRRRRSRHHLCAQPQAGHQLVPRGPAGSVLFGGPPGHFSAFSTSTRSDPRRSRRLWCLFILFSFFFVRRLFSGAPASLRSGALRSGRARLGLPTLAAPSGVKRASPAASRWAPARASESRGFGSPRFPRRSDDRGQRDP